MKTSMTLSKLIELTYSTIQRFEGINHRKWGVEAMIAELTSEVGTLADSIMILEGYRQKRSGQETDLNDDICDILFILLYIARHYNINFEAAYKRMLEKTNEKLTRIEGVNHHV